MRLAYLIICPPVTEARCTTYLPRSIATGALRGAVATTVAVHVEERPAQGRGRAPARRGHHGDALLRLAARQSMQRQQPGRSDAGNSELRIEFHARENPHTHVLYSSSESELHS
jgi:hypothetical protein